MQAKVEFPTPRSQKIVKWPGFAPGGGGDVEVSILSAHNATALPGSLTLHVFKATNHDLPI